jgi:nucleoside-diphosphate-sugar epimerase
MAMAIASESPVLVLGGTGFLGSHLTAALIRDGVKAIVIPSESVGNEERLCGLISGAIRQHDPSTVFHLIGSGLPAERADPGYHVTKNVGAARAVARAMRSSHFGGSVVFTSTGAVYGNTPIPVSECAPLCPLTPHAQSKLEAERILCDAAPRVVVTRLFQLYGEGQRKLVVHDLARRIHLEDGPLRLQSTGSETRDLAYVEDVASALRRLAESRSSLTNGTSVFNVASGVGTRIDDLAQRLLGIAGQGHRRVVPSPQADRNPLKASVGDPAKLAQLGLQVPAVSDATLARTLEWTATYAD